MTDAELATIRARVERTITLPAMQGDAGLWATAINAAVRDAVILLAEVDRQRALIARYRHLLAGDGPPA